MNLNLPEGWVVYPLIEVTIGLFAILIIMLIVQIMTLRVLRSFLPPKEPDHRKQQMENLNYDDLR